MIQIGYTQKTHGVAGEIKVNIEPVYEDLFLEQKRVFLDIKGQKVPYFIQHARGGGVLIVKFEDVPNREEAQKLQSKGIFLPKAEVTIVEAVPEAVYASLVGYVLADRTLGDIGPIERIIDLPQHELAEVRYQNRLVLVPLHEQSIVYTDKLKRRVLTDLPEGLLDL